MKSRNYHRPPEPKVGDSNSPWRAKNPLETIGQTELAGDQERQPWLGVATIQLHSDLGSGAHQAVRRHGKRAALQAAYDAASAQGLHAVTLSPPPRPGPSSPLPTPSGAPGERASAHAASPGASPAPVVIGGRLPCGHSVLGLDLISWTCRCGAKAPDTPRGLKRKHKSSGAATDRASAVESVERRATVVASDPPVTTRTGCLDYGDGSFGWARIGGGR